MISMFALIKKSENFVFYSIFLFYIIFLFFEIFYLTGSKKFDKFGKNFTYLATNPKNTQKLFQAKNRYSSLTGRTMDYFLVVNKFILWIFWIKNYSDKCRACVPHMR